jgi:subfamily B ATP-binding cassette protein MsbA
VSASDDRAMMRVLGRLLRQYVRPHLGTLGVTFVFMFIVAGSSAALAWLLDPAVKMVFIEKRQDMLLLVPLAIVGISLLRAAAGFAQTYFMSRVGLRIVLRIQEQLVRHFVEMDLRDLDARHKGQIMAVFNNSTIISQATSQAITALVRDSLTVLFLLGVMYYQDVYLALVASAVFPIVLYNSNKRGQQTRAATINSMQETGAINALVYDSVDGNRIVKSYCREEFEIDRATQRLRQRLRHEIKASRARALGSPVTEAITGLGIAAAVLYGGWQGISANLELNEFVSFLAAMLMAYGPMKALTNLRLLMTTGLTAAEMIFGELDRERTTVERPDAVPLVLDAGRIRFEGVTFAYEPDRPALRSLDLECPPRRTTALVGPSGAGKSTMLNLILRFFDPASGRILIDDQDLQDVTLRSLREQIGLVTQDPFLFDDTILANIRYGRPDATEAEVMEAARAAAAHEFIEATAEGYHTRIGQDGIRLSGGQRQRLAIARAMLKDAPILLMDEATSALDAVSERHIQDAMRALRANRTVIVIAHRLSTVIDADVIHVLDHGQVAESGTHESLVRAGGLYAKLYETQLVDDTVPATDGASGRGVPAGVS